MNLSMLWSHERTRVSMQMDEVGSLQRCVHESHSNGLVPEEKEKHRTLARGSSSLRSSSVAPLSLQAFAPSQYQQQQAATGSAAPYVVDGASKKRSTVFVKRETIFKKLLEESVVPAVNAVATVQNFFDCNEFAMEYADRAPKRFYGQSSSSAAANSSSSTAGNSSSSLNQSNHLSNANSSLASSTSGVASPQRKEKKATLATPRSSMSRSGAVNASQHSSSSAVAGMHAGVSSSLLNATPSSSKPSFLSRKNGRKKLGSDFNSHAFRPYIGDMFGTRGEYIDGMLYMSRMKRSYQITFGDGGRKLFGNDIGANSASWIDLSHKEGRHALKDTVSDALSTAPASGNHLGSTSSATVKTLGSHLPSSDADLEQGDRGFSEESLQMKQRRRCSLTLSNWSSNPENAMLMVQENVVEALILLCQVNDSVTRLNCVTALMNLSHIVELRQVIVRQGAVKTVSEIVDETEDKTLRTACAITLCNLCCLEGEEETLVEDGAVSALSVLITEQPKVSWICRSALFNLTCVREPYQKIESVLKMFITLTTSSGGGSSKECDEITAKALCNLSNFKRIRLRLMEEGIVNAISSLIHMRAPAIQEMLAYVMLNLSAVRACRSEMVAKGCMGTLVSLTRATSASATKFLIASTLFHLSKEPGNRLRMVFEGLLLLVNELCRGSVGFSGGEALRRVCASTLYNISCNDDTRAKLVERDAVSVLSSLSKRTSDSDAKKMCTLALCNLLSVQQAAADIMNAGAITALIQLSMAPDQTLETKRLFSQALHGLCEQSETRDAVARAGVISAIIYLSSVEQNPADGDDGAGSPSDMAALNRAGLLSEIRARCTAALACLAADERITVQVCSLPVVLCVTKILVFERSHIATERFCCSCLSLLCRDEHCSHIMADEGAIEVVLSTCMETQDLETKASCCHVLASMSCHPSCCMALVRMGVISVLATLAKIKGDTSIQRCCAITLANLSVEPAIRDVLVTAGIVAILSMLSNSYSEDNQRDCAKVLCNLSCVPGNEAHLVSEGAIGVLMMISMVRAVNASTKETCVRALFNLLNAETIKPMVQEGIVKILPTFAALESGSASEIVTMLYMKLINHPVGRNALCIERSALKSLFALMESMSPANDQAAIQFESLLCELVYYENSRLPSVHAGIIDALHKISMRSGIRSAADSPKDQSCTAKRLALALFTLSKYEDTRMAVASSASIATLTTFLKRHPPRAGCYEGECVVFAVSTFCSLAWHDVTRGRLDHPEISSVLVQLLTTNSGVEASDADHLGYYPASAIKTTVLTLCCLSQSEEMLHSMLHGRIIDCLYGILCRDSPRSCHANAQLIEDQEFLALVCILFRQLSHAPLFSSMVGTQASLIIPLFCTLTQLVVEKDPDSCLDCADALCSVTFAAVKTPQATPKSKSDPAPCATLVAPNVIKAIDSLMADSQLPETRWRCAASLWALSLVPEYRDRLVSLGCTRLLVGESYRTESSVHLSILTCCAGALCNLTIVSGDVANKHAARMVEEDAVPALLQLSKLENAEVREHCTLALTNLSGQSPKVESGAVSALLNLSLQTTSSSGAPSVSCRRASAGTNTHGSTLCRPPIVRGDRQKHFSRLPDFSMAFEPNEALGECKYEGDLVASTPPPPHLPTIPVGMDSSSEPASSNNGPDELLHMKASSGAHDDGTSGDRDGDQRLSMTRSFPKVDPAESRLLAGADGDDSSRDNNDSQQDGSLNQETKKDGAGSNDSEENRSGDNDPGEQGESLGQLRKTISHKGSVGRNNSSGGYSLSPLARVVVRKSQTAQVAKKLKDLRGRSSEKRGDGGGSSTPSTPLSSARRSDGPPTLLPSRNSINRNITAAGVSSRAILSSLQDSNKSAFDGMPPESTSTVGCYSKSETGGSQSSCEPQPSLAAAAAAARLYGAPANESVKERGTKTIRHHGKKREKLKTKVRKPNVSSPSSRAKYAPASPLDDSESDGGADSPTTKEHSVILTSAIQDFRAQAKKFGLWS